MVFGDGDGVLFTDFTGSLDVIAHELTHGVTEFTAGLSITISPGALNESMSDVFGSLVKQWVAQGDRRPGRLADRRGDLHARHRRRRAAVDEGAGQGLQQSRSARTRSPTT